MMDPVTLILAAIAAGVASGATETVSQAVQDGYTGLKQLLTARFVGHPKAAQTLAEHEADPDTYEKPLAKQLQETRADQDGEILAAAEAVLKAADQAGVKTKYQIMVTGGKVGIIGDHGHVTMN
jgi:hypothetical protein